MALYFISGVPGSGKSTLVEELRYRGEEAHDTDDECVMISKQTGDVVDYDNRKNDPYDWIYPKQSLQKLKDLSVTKDVFIAGSVDNFDDVNNASDEYIWLEISLDELQKRLDTRHKDYGKSKSERQSIVDLHNEMRNLIGPKLFKLDATKNVEQIADELLAHVKSN